MKITGDQHKQTHTTDNRGAVVTQVIESSFQSTVTPLDLVLTPYCCRVEERQKVKVIVSTHFLQKEMAFKLHFQPALTMSQCHTPDPPDGHKLAETV